MKPKKEVLENLSPMQRHEILVHFNTIYQCDKLTAHEGNIVYLAYMWKNGLVQSCSDGMHSFDDNVRCVELENYELVREVPEGDEGGINLAITYEFYELEKLMEMVQLLN